MMLKTINYKIVINIYIETERFFMYVYKKKEWVNTFRESEEQTLGNNQKALVVFVFYESTGK